MTWAAFFDQVAGEKLDSTPQTFNVNEESMTKSQMLKHLAVHVDSLETNMTQTKKLFDNAKKREEKCVKGQSNKAEKTKKRVAEMISSPVRQEKIEANKIFCSISYP